MWERSPVEAGTDEIEGLLRKGKLTDAAFDEIGRKGASAVNDVLDRWDRIDRLLREAALIVRESAPGLTGYEARRRVVSEFRGQGKPHARFTLKPDPCLTPPADVPPSPGRAPAYDHLFRLEGGYWNDPAYMALAELPPKDLPDGAMLALCSLWRIGDTGLRRGDEWGMLREELLARYGERLFPAAIEYLSYPERYGWDCKVAHNAVGTAWFPPPAGHPLARVAANWRAPEVEDFLRLFLEAGWNYAGSVLPDRPWARSLFAEFQASPYGRPTRPVWAN